MRRAVLWATVLVIATAAVGCGSDGSGPGAAGALALGSASGQGGGGGSASESHGMVNLTVDGTKSTFDSEPCYLLKIGDVNFTITAANGLTVVLPGTPGAFATEDFGNVILPPPSGDDEYRPAGDVHGQWSKDGDTASGHVEGVAHLISGLTSGDDRDHPFSFDFTCPYSDLTGADGASG